MCFARVERVGYIVDVLRDTSHSGFPVIADPPGGFAGGGSSHITGVVLRSQLRVLLASRRAFQPSPSVSEAASRIAFSYGPSDFARHVTDGGGARLEGGQLTPGELGE